MIAFRYEGDRLVRRAGPREAALPHAAMEAREFVESHRKEFPGAEISYHSAAGHDGCQILVEAIGRAGSLDSGKLREAILEMDPNTVFGGFRVDRDGLQIAHKMVMFSGRTAKGHRPARGADAREAALPDAAVESTLRKRGAAMRSLLRALPWGCLSIAVGLGALASAEAQQPLTIGASFSNTGNYAQLGQMVHRGQQLCVEHANEKGGVLAQEDRAHRRG